ncbi:MAG: hypothetical protein HYU69_15465 [Bacteroidetes bacterium]|nr:hypothetical protein [Bacteroidota bacterium]
MRILTFNISLFVIVQSLVAQSVGSSFTGHSSGWARNNIFQNKVFIENKGQFDGKDNQASSEIRFGIQDEGQQIYFTQSGLTFRYDKNDFPKEREGEDETFASAEEEEAHEREMRKKVIAKTYFVNMKWVNADLRSQLTAEGMVPEYYTYGDEKKSYKVSAFKKVLYKNIYPNVDIEYVFHEKEGIKYSLILHSGADVSKIKMRYSGQDKLIKDKDGNAHIVTALGDIVDHAPLTFYSADGITGSGGSIIESSFIIDDNIVSFKLAPYDRSKTIVIDPWTVGVTLTATNKVLQLEKDLTGNIYILGGGDGSGTLPLLLKKYSSAGTLIWTYTPVAGSCNGQYGDDLKIGPGGNIYMSAGYNGNNAVYSVLKLNPAGTVLWSRNGFEPYRFLYDYCSGTLYLSQGNSSVRCLILDDATGVQLGQTPSLPAFVTTECRDIVQGPDRNYYAMTVNTGGSCAKASPNLSSILFNVPHGYGFAYLTAGAALYTGHVSAQPGTMHCIIASRLFVYTTNGGKLERRDLATGNIINTIPLPGGVVFGNSGFAVDTCDNIYVGSSNGVYKYSPNLTLITSAPTTGAVYDVSLGSNPGEILACGNGFLASLNMGACNPIPLILAASATPTGNCSNGNTGTATANVTGGVSTFSYYWLPGGQTTRTITGLAAGTYSVIVTDINCVKDTVAVTVTSTGAIAVSVSSQMGVHCQGANDGSATVVASGGVSPYTYLWSTGNTTASVTGLSVGMYTVTATDGNGCQSTVSVDITQPFFPKITITSSVYNDPCGASSNALPSVTGGTAPYTYSWSSGQTIRIITGLAQGSYTLTVTDSAGCAATLVENFTNPNIAPIASFTKSPGSPVCIGTKVDFTHTGTTGSGVTYNWFISPITPANVSGTTTNFSYTFLTTGNYIVQHSVTRSGCSASKTDTVKVINCSVPTITATGNSVCPGSCGSVTSSSSGGAGPYTYLWSNGATTQNIAPCPVSTTVYTVTITDSGGATSTATATITINPSVTVTVTAANTSCTESTNGSVSASVASGTAPYTYNWSVSMGTTSAVSGLTAGNYTVTITDSKGCTTTSTAVINSPPPLIGQFAKGTASCASCGCKEWIMVTATGGTSPYSYSWPASGNYSNRYLNQLCPGTYVININDKNGCNVNINLTAP